MVAYSQSPTRDDVSSVIATIEHAYYSHNVAVAEEAIATLDEFQAQYRAWALWRLANMYPIDGVNRRTKKINEGIRAPLLDEAEDLLDRYTAAHSEDGEGFLILSQVYQSRITGMMSGMRYGRRAGETLHKAFLLSPKNPNVVCYQGINLLMAPGPFGDKDEGRRKLREAGMLFAASDANEYRWGEPEVWAYLGLALAKEGDATRARELYDRALALEPEYLWVKKDLLPTLPK